MPHYQLGCGAARTHSLCKEPFSALTSACTLTHEFQLPLNPFIVTVKDIGMQGVLSSHPLSHSGRDVPGYQHKHEL